MNSIAISVRQPWAQLIVMGFKPVENRDWPESYGPRKFITKYRGRLLIQAAAGMTREEWEYVIERVDQFDPEAIDALLKRFTFDTIPRGCIVGETTVVDFVNDHPSPYFGGPEAIVLKDSREWTQPVKCRGMLGFFKSEAIEPRDFVVGEEVRYVNHVTGHDLGAMKVVGIDGDFVLCERYPSRLNPSSFHRDGRATWSSNLCIRHQ